LASLFVLLVVFMRAKLKLIF